LPVIAKFLVEVVEGTPGSFNLLGFMLEQATPIGGLKTLAEFNESLKPKQRPTGNAVNQITVATPDAARFTDDDRARAEQIAKQGIESGLQEKLATEGNESKERLIAILETKKKLASQELSREQESLENAEKVFEATARELLLVQKNKQN